MVVTTVLEREEEVSEPESEELQAAPVLSDAAPEQPRSESSWSLADESEQAPVTDTTPEPQFEPAVVDEVPPLAWSDDQQIQSAAEIEIDDESSMRWSEEKPHEEPTAADPNAGLPEFLTQEIPLIQEPAESDRDRKRREKAERKAQKKAARDSRHAND